MGGTLSLCVGSRVVYNLCMNVKGFERSLSSGLGTLGRPQCPSVYYGVCYVGNPSLLLSKPMVH